MHTVKSECTLTSNKVGATPNRARGTWDGSGDRLLVRQQVVPDRSSVTDVSWQFACADLEIPLDVYDALKSIGYRDPLDP